MVVGRVALQDAFLPENILAPGSFRKKRILAGRPLHPLTTDTPMPTPRRNLTEYQRRYRKRRRRVDVLFERDEYEQIKRAATRHSMKVGPFIRACVGGYLQRVYVLPDDEALRRLQLGIRRIGNNLNQLVRHAHRAGLEPVDIDAMNRHLATLEDEIIVALQEPPELLDVIDRALREKPYLAGEMQAVLDAYAEAE